MSKRGRPSVFSVHGQPKLEKTIDSFRPDETQRTKANDFYAARGRNVIWETVSENPRMKAIYNRERIMIQLGRMNAQDGYNQESCMEVATIAAEMYRNGFKVEQIEKYIRKVRISGIIQNPSKNHLVF